MALGEAPKLDKWRYKFTFISLSTDVCKTYNEVILQKVLDNNVSIDSGQIKVDSESINHLELVMFHEIPQNALDLSFRYVFYSSMFNKLLQNFEENSLGPF